MDEPKSAGNTPIVQKTKPGTYWWCQCGLSSTQPFCDGSHKGTGFGPVKQEIETERQVAWCTCKKTGSAPFCDGSHSRNS